MSWSSGGLVSSRYQREYESYVRGHRSLGNLAIHAVLVPIEQLCALWVVASTTSVRVAVMLQLCTLCAARPLIFGVAQCAMIVPALTWKVAAWKAVAGNLTAVAFQVVVGHGWLDGGSRPSALADGLTAWSILFQVHVAWEAFLRRLWIAACRSLCFMHWACSPRIAEACRKKEPRSIFYCLDGKSVRIETRDEETLGAFVLMPPQLADPESARRVVLFFHGNCGSRYGVFSPARRPSARVELCRALATLFGDTVVVGFDYRGFADSTGSPSEEGLARDSEAALAFASKLAPNARIVLYGQSLGSAVASRLAASCDKEQRVDAVVLDATFPSIARAALSYPLVRPLATLLRSFGLLDSALRAIPDAFETGAPRVPPRVPLLFVHKDRDEIVPVALGREVYRAAAEARSSSTEDHYTRFLQIDGTTKIMRRHHVDAFTSPEWKAAIQHLFLHVDHSSPPSSCGLKVA